MNTLIPLEYYQYFYFNLLLAIIVLVFLQANFLQLTDHANLRFKNILGIIFFVFTVVYIGTRPISGYYFIDMRTYADNFDKYANGEAVTSDKDVVVSP